MSRIWVRMCGLTWKASVRLVHSLGSRLLCRDLPADSLPPAPAPLFFAALTIAVAIPLVVARHGRRNLLLCFSWRGHPSARVAFLKRWFFLRTQTCNLSLANLEDRRASDWPLCHTSDSDIILSTLSDSLIVIVALTGTKAEDAWLSRASNPIWSRSKPTRHPSSRPS